MFQRKANDEMSKSKNTSEKSNNVWNSYMAKCIEIYLLFLMVVYVLFCREGYVEYDIHKRNLFFAGSIFFTMASLVIVLLSMSEAKKGDWKKYFEKADLWMVGLFVSWGAGIFLCRDKSVTLWGDVYRYMGLVFMLLSVITMWIISRYAKWTKLLSRVLLGVGAIIFVWQILNFYYIDPLNWTFDGKYHFLMSTLGNLNQNACFDVIVLAMAMAMFVLIEKGNEQKIIAAFLFVGYMAGIATSSATYYLGIAIIFMVMFGYCLIHTKNLLKFWFQAVLFVFAALAQKLLYLALGDQWVAIDGITQMLFDVRTLLILVVLLAILGILFWKCESFFEQKGKLLLGIYIVLIAIVLVLGLGCFIYANTSGISAEDGGFFSHLVMNDMSGNARWLIWKCTIGMFAQEPIAQKLFGSGLSSYSTHIYEYYAEELMAVWGVENRLADAHNVFLDMLASSGIVGAVSYFGVSIHVLIQSMKKVASQPAALMAILTIPAWIAVGLVNANLIVTTPLYFGLLGIFWSIVRTDNHKTEETV